MATELARKQYSTKVKHLSVLINCSYFLSLKINFFCARFSNSFTTSKFGGCVTHILIPRYCDYCSKCSPTTFGIKTKCPLQFSNESKATSCPQTFDWTYKGS